MQWSSEERKNFERESFKNAIEELIRQTNKCLEKYIEENGDIVPGEVKTNGLTHKPDVEKYLGFLGNYGYEFKVGNFHKQGTGNLVDHTWMYFASKDTFNKENDGDFINGDKLDGKKGIWIYFSYCGYYEKKPYLQLGFGADASLNNPLCKAARKIQEYEKKYHKYEADESQFNKIVDDFIEMCEYFNDFEPDDFRIENSVQNLGAKDSSNGAESARVNIPLNQILFGPPGTGKTYHTINNALEILGFATKDFESKKVVLDDEKIKQEVTKLGLKIELKENQDENRAMAKALFDDFKQKGQIAFVTFHQSYGYEEFVEGIKPDVESNEVRYEIKSGIFKNLCEAALKNPQIPYILIIDEINRGNIAKILGELITLLESSKRIGEPEGLRVSLPYSGDEFGVPKNLYIIGTMNTADRSIALLDTALRRRFEFIEMMPDSKHLSEDCDGVNLKELLDSMNKRITFLLDREHQIGHSFLLDVNNINDLRAIFAKKILPLLQEYFYDDYAKINAALNDNGMIQEIKQGDLGSALSEFVDSEKVVYEITESNTWEFDTFIKIYPSK